MKNDKHIKDSDYYLVDGAGWFEYNGLVVRLFDKKEINCLEISTFISGKEDEDPICSEFVEYPKKAKSKR
jgi:hypothetical protein